MEKRKYSESAAATSSVAQPNHYKRQRTMSRSRSRSPEPRNLPSTPTSNTNRTAQMPWADASRQFPRDTFRCAIHRLPSDVTQGYCAAGFLPIAMIPTSTLGGGDANGEQRVEYVKCVLLGFEPDKRTRECSLNVLGGKREIDDRGDPERTAKREFWEETGKVRQPVDIGDLFETCAQHGMAAIVNGCGKYLLYIGNIPEPVPDWLIHLPKTFEAAEKDETAETIALHWIPLTELMQALNQGSSIRHGGADLSITRLRRIHNQSCIHRYLKDAASNYNEHEEVQRNNTRDSDWDRDRVKDRYYHRDRDHDRRSRDRDRYRGRDRSRSRDRDRYRGRDRSRSRSRSRESERVRERDRDSCERERDYAREVLTWI